MVKVKELELPGVKTYDLKIFPDERGFFAESTRKDWKELLGEDEIVQTSVSCSFPGVIRAWHRHSRGQVDYFLVLKGAVKICAYDGREESPTKGKLVEILVNENKLQVVRIPGFYWHGTKSVGTGDSLTMYLLTELYDYKNPDEERLEWNDPSIIDPKTDEAYDWNKPLTNEV